MKLTPREIEIVKVLAKGKNISLEEAEKSQEILDVVEFRRKNVEKDLRARLLEMTPKEEEAEPKLTPFEERKKAQEESASKFEKYRTERDKELFKTEKRAKGRCQYL